MKIPMNGVVFNLEGSLINTNDLHRHAWSEEIAQAPQASVTWQQIDHLLRQGMLVASVFRYHFPHLPHDPDSVLAWVQLMAVKYHDHTFPIAGAARLLDTLDALNIPWAVVCDVPRYIAQMWLCKVYGKPRRVLVLVLEEMLHELRPLPEAYLLAIDQLNVDGLVVAFELDMLGTWEGVVAGCEVIAVKLDRWVVDLRQAGATCSIPDYEGIDIQALALGFEIDIVKAVM